MARIYLRHPVMYSQDQVCDSNHAECVLFSQSLVTRHNTKAYFLQHNAGCSQFCNNPRFPVRRQSMGVKIMRIDLVAHRLVRELIADCLGPTFKTHVRSFMNKGHVVKNATKLPAFSFHLEKLCLSACMDVACEQALPLGESREATRELYAKEDASVRSGKREEELSSLHSIDLLNFFKRRVSKGAAKIHGGSARPSSVIDDN